MTEGFVVVVVVVAGCDFKIVFFVCMFGSKLSVLYTEFMLRGRGNVVLSYSSTLIYRHCYDELLLDRF